MQGSLGSSEQQGRQQRHAARQLRRMASATAQAVEPLVVQGAADAAGGASTAEACAALAAGAPPTAPQHSDPVQPDGSCASAAGLVAAQASGQPGVREPGLGCDALVAGESAEQSQLQREAEVQRDSAGSGHQAQATGGWVSHAATAAAEAAGDLQPEADLAAAAAAAEAAAAVAAAAVAAAAAEAAADQGGADAESPHPMASWRGATPPALLPEWGGSEDPPGERVRRLRPAYWAAGRLAGRHACCLPPACRERRGVVHAGVLLSRELRLNRTHP